MRERVRVASVSAFAIPRRTRKVEMVRAGVGAGAHSEAGSSMLQRGSDCELWGARETARKKVGDSVRENGRERGRERGGKSEREGEGKSEGERERECVCVCVYVCVCVCVCVCERVVVERL